MTNCEIILCDIEGTTTPIEFVKKVLFPFASKNLETFLKFNWDDTSVQESIELLKQSLSDNNSYICDNVVSFNEIGNDQSASLQSLMDYIKWLMDNDRKVTGLKNLQGLVWEKGYNKGELQGEIYEDVPVAFERWTAQNIKIFIYSSGSVQAQKLLFGHSKYGNLLKYISGHFDTTSGFKQERSSYINIASSLSVLPNKILFLTDIVNEAEAASAAGMHVAVVDRPGNNPLSEDDKKKYLVISSFPELDFNKSTK